MLPATCAELLQLQPIRLGLPVLGRRIVPLFAVTALHRNNFSGHFLAPYPCRSFSTLHSSLLHNLRNGSSAHGMPAFTDGKPQALFHGHRRDQLDHQAYIVPLHHHLGSRRQLCYSGDVGGPQIKLWTISLEEWRMPPAFFFGQDVNLSLELGMWRDRATFRQDHPTLDIFFRNTAQQQPSIVSRHAFIQLLLEHFDARDHRLAGFAEADNLYFFSHFHFAALDSSRHHRASARDRENIFNRHQERLFNLPLGDRHRLIHRRHQRVNLLFPLGFPVQRAQRRQTDHGNIVAWKLIALQQLAYFQFHQIEQLRIIHRIALVQGNDDVRHSHLPRQQNVLARLRHRTIGRRDHQNRAIHLRRARNHVLDVIRVPRAIDVRIMPLVGLIFHVGRGDGDAAGFFFRRVINRIKRPELDLGIVFLQHLGDGRRQRGLAMINVTNGAYVHVRLIAFKFLFRHFRFAPSVWRGRPRPRLSSLRDWVFFTYPGLTPWAKLFRPFGAGPFSLLFDRRWPTTKDERPTTLLQ